MVRCTLPLLAAAAGLAACAATSGPKKVESPARLDPEAAVTLAAFSSAHGLRVAGDPSRRRLVLSGRGNRILLFPGTSVGVVNGRRVPGLGRVRAVSGRWVLRRRDAELLAEALRTFPPRVARRGPPPAAPPPGGGGRPHPSPAPPPPAPAAWRVPLTRTWRWIVIHHSGTAGGNAASFDRHHRRDNGWDGLGYDFVIGNGRGAPDGAVEVGYRWTRQLTGAHAGRAADGSNLMNETSIGICLVGDFDRTVPTRAQRRALHRLLAFLEGYCRIPPDHVLLHRDLRRTDCPGRRFPAPEFVRARRVVPAGRP